MEFTVKTRPRNNYVTVFGASSGWIVGSWPTWQLWKRCEIGVQGDKWMGDSQGRPSRLLKSMPEDDILWPKPGLFKQFRFRSPPLQSCFPVDKMKVETCPWVWSGGRAESWELMPPGEIFYWFLWYSTYKTMCNSMARLVSLWVSLALNLLETFSESI